MIKLSLYEMQRTDGAVFKMHENMNYQLKEENVNPGSSAFIN